MHKETKMRLVLLIVCCLFLSAVTFVLGYDSGYIQALEDLTQILSSDSPIEEMYY